MAAFTGQFEYHKEENIVKNVADNKFNPLTEAAKRKVLTCPQHPGLWISKPKLFGFSQEVRDCPSCVVGLLPDKTISTEVVEKVSPTPSVKTVSSEDTSVKSVPSETTLKYPDGSYTGGFIFDESGLAVRHGRGIMKYNNGNVYDGDFVNNKKVGQGHFRFASGSHYRGDFTSNNMHGHGVFTYADGDVYEGTFKDGVKTGSNCIYRFQSGSVYVGDFANDRKDGKGELAYANGDKYNGDFRAGLRHGRGIYVFANGDVYDGEWANDCKHGAGTLRYANGSVYSGEFKNDHKGVGVVTLPNGKKKSGSWFSGKA